MLSRLFDYLLVTVVTRPYHNFAPFVRQIAKEARMLWRFFAN
jgi:hypothetical protein